MAIKKSDLYSSLWQSCDELRGGMDASQYKDYVLFMLFIKYISDKYGNNKVYAPQIEIPPGASFADMLDLRGKRDIGDKINKQVIAPLVQANDRLGRADFPDFNDRNRLGQGNEMVDRLTNLINIFHNSQLDFSKNRAEQDDILGDAYEYLMRHFATESGKSKGQFYTPAEVSRVMAEVIGISPQNTKGSTTAYDPTCGSGSLLLKVAVQAHKPITLDGQEKDVTTAGLARMNMILHGFPAANIKTGNTLTNPKFKNGSNLQTYDYVVANPPFSDKTWTTGLTPSTDQYQRFAWGEPPAKQGDYAYLLHIIRSMKRTGKAACVLPHGVLFRGNAEAKIRKKLVQSGCLKGIIGLPPNLFYGTGIPACIVVLDKENAAGRKGVFMIDASKGFSKDGPKNRLRDQDIHKIVDAFSRLSDIQRYSRMVSFEEIASDTNEFNLNLPRYIDNTEPEDLHDIEAHLLGGIPRYDVDALDDSWQVFPGLFDALFNSADRPGYLQLQVDHHELNQIIHRHPDFTKFEEEIQKIFTTWKNRATSVLAAFGTNGRPKELIRKISEDLLTTFKDAKLIDAYDIYQHLMDYWTDTMQDDMYLIALDGWVKGAQPQEIVQDKDKNGKLTWPKTNYYLVGKRRFESNLLPSTILVDHFFNKEKVYLFELDSRIAALEQKLEESVEEQGGEDGLLAEVVDRDKQKILKKAVNARLKEIGDQPHFEEELEALQNFLVLMKELTSVKSHRKVAQVELDNNIDAKYSTLTELEIKSLVLDRKWMVHLADCLQSEVDGIAQSLTTRIGQLAERYETPLPILATEVDTIASRIEQHLSDMGVSWK